MKQKQKQEQLENRLLSFAASFMKFARRKLHREYKYSSDENLTFRYWIDSIMP